MAWALPLDCTGEPHSHSHDDAARRLRNRSFHEETQEYYLFVKRRTEIVIHEPYEICQVYGRCHGGCFVMINRLEQYKGEQKIHVERQKILLSGNCRRHKINKEHSRTCIVTIHCKDGDMRF